MRRLITTGQRDREAALIERLAHLVPSIGHKGDRAFVRLGIGDDAAVLRPSARSEWVISCDSTLEAVHFHPDYPPESIGYKALARATSDLAAMGAVPRYFLLALALPTAKVGKWLDRFAAGMSRASREFDSLLIGGDVSRTASVSITITVIGEIPAGLSISRSGAKPGDLIFVSGTLGAAQLGLEIIRRKLSGRPSLAKYLRCHFYPQIPIALGRILSRRRIPSAMMDISDGLSTDLARLCAASRVGAQIRVDSLPVCKVPDTLLGHGIDPTELAVHGGDDYGLLFTVPPSSAQRLRRIARGGAAVTHIGEITRERGIVSVQTNGQKSLLLAKGWDHFR